MKRFFGIFVLTRSEQHLVIVVMIALVTWAWIKHHHDMNLSELRVQNEEIPPAPLGSPAPNDKIPKEEPENPLNVGR